MKLRTRFALALSLIAVIPTVCLAIWARTSLVSRARVEYQSILDARVESVKRAITRRTERDRNMLGALCDNDISIDALMKSLTTESADGEPARRRIATEAPRMMEARGFDTLVVLDLADGASLGRILASGHDPKRVGARDVALAQDLLAADGQPFMRSNDEQQVLSLGCQTPTRDGVRLGVIGGRVLSDALYEDLRGDVSDLRLVDSAPTGEDLPNQRVIHELRNAQGTTVASLVSSIDVSGLTAQIDDITRTALLVGIAMLMLSLFLAWLLSRRLSKDIDSITRFARKVGRGDLSSQFEVKRNDEMGELQAQLNLMTQELAKERSKAGDNQKRALRAERIAAWQDVARLVAHEIKNPLSPIQVSIETMRKTHAKKHPDFDEIFEESTVMILEEVDRMKTLVSEFSQFARLPRPKVNSLHVQDLVGHVVSLHQGTDVAVELISEDGLLAVRGDREQLTQVFVNLVQNGTEAAQARHGGAGGRVAVLLQKAQAGVLVVVRDNGPGVPKEQRERIFEPYHTTKSTGTGLGLAVVHRIVSDHGGSIEVHDADDGGAEFHVFLSSSGPLKEVEATRTDMSIPLTVRTRH